MDWPILQRRSVLSLLFWSLLVGFTGTPRADSASPEVQLRLARGPYYVGESIDVHLQVTGLERSPEPSCHGEAPAGARLEWRGTQPSVSSSMRIEGGQVRRTETVTFTCQFVLVPSKPGRVRIDPLEMRQGTVRAQSEAYGIQVESIPLDPRLKIEILPQATSMVLGQRVSIRIEWQLDAELDEKLRRYSIRSPLFEMPDTFRFLDDMPGPRKTATLQIQTSVGEIAIPAEVNQRIEGNREYLVLSAERTLMPLKQGQFQLEGPTVSAEEVTRWQRDLFGSRRPAASRRLFAQGEPLEWTVGEAPATGRPESFAGAIGQGFSLEASADRSVVKQGDPIELTLVVRGEGHLGSVGIPKLDRAGALSPDAFRIAREAPTGEI
ncbi:BatD family protein, partial [Myxococcota bacterium]|nr:BatD family protein [Myxococcota bacterium]